MLCPARWFMKNFPEAVRAALYALTLAAAVVETSCDSSNQPTPAVGAPLSGSGGQPTAAETSDHKTNFFVSSDTSKTANLGGLDGADARCTALAKAAGFSQKTWRAYLSAGHGAPATA